VDKESETTFVSFSTCQKYCPPQHSAAHVAFVSTKLQVSSRDCFTAVFGRTGISTETPGLINTRPGMHGSKKFQPSVRGVSSVCPQPPPPMISMQGTWEYSRRMSARADRFEGTDKKSCPSKRSHFLLSDQPKIPSVQGGPGCSLASSSLAPILSADRRGLSSAARIYLEARLRRQLSKNSSP